MRIDAHQHFWSYDPVAYDWIGPGMEVLARDYLPEQLVPELETCAIDGAISVQARQDEAETDWLLELAKSPPQLLGVIGWTDLCAPNIEERLSDLAKNPLLVGLRHVLQDEPDDRFMLLPEFQAGIACLAQHDLVYDLLLYPRHLAPALELVDLAPQQSFVLDHLGKPCITLGTLEPWSRDLKQLAQRPNVTCKLSGLVTEADWATWTLSDLTPYLDQALAAFGPERLMFGSDWPVCTLAGTYQQVQDAVNTWAEALSPSEQAAIFGGTAERIYLTQAPC
jgi:L-fuconolactonase